MLDLNQFSLDNDCYASFVCDNDFSNLADYPLAYALFQDLGIGANLCEDGSYDHESGQLTAEWNGAEYEPEAYEVLVQIANDYAEFVMSQV